MSEQEHDTSSKDQPWPGLPAPLEHRLSTKWATLESLRILQERLTARGIVQDVVLFTTSGILQGKLVDVSDTYEDSVAGETVADVDVPSAVVHLRTELWSMYAQKDKELIPVDSGALIHLMDVTTRVGNRNVHFKHLAVFASEVVAFTLTSDGVI